MYNRWFDIKKDSTCGVTPRGCIAWLDTCFSVVVTNCGDINKLIGILKSSTRIVYTEANSLKLFFKNQVII